MEWNLICRTAVGEKLLTAYDTLEGARKSAVFFMDVAREGGYVWNKIGDDKWRGVCEMQTELGTVQIEMILKIDF